MTRPPPAQLPPRSVTRKDVIKFTDHCVGFRAVWTHYKILFEGSDLQRELLQRTANRFFHDLNRMLIEHLILNVCKLTDPESTLGRRNLTVQFLFKNADLSNSPRQFAKLKKLVHRMGAFRKRIALARNRLISHLDLDAATLRRKSLGGASVAAWRRFWRDLEDFLAILHWRYVNARAPFCLNDIGMISDADQLVKALKESTYFHAALKDKTLTGQIDSVAFGSRYYQA